MTKEVPQEQPKSIKIGEETLSKFIDEFTQTPGYLNQTLALLQEKDSELAEILKGNLTLGRRNVQEPLQTGLSQKTEILVGAALAWRLIYNENPSLPLVGNRETSVVTEPDFESVVEKDPVFGKFVSTFEVEAAMPRLFRLGAMITYGLKQSALAQ